MAISKIDPAGLDLTGDAAFDSDTLVVDSTNNRVGIGTSSPSVEMEVVGDIKADTLELGRSGVSNGQISSDLSLSLVFDADEDESSRVFNVLRGTSEAMRIDSSGNVGIGTSSPNASYKLHVAGGVIIDSGSFINLNGTSTAADPQLTLGQGGVGLFRPASDVIGFSTNDTEAARIDSSGQLMVGTTTGSSERVLASVTSGTVNGFAARATNTSGGVALVCRKSTGSSVGSVSFTNTATSFNTSSDYRLKEDWVPMEQSIERVKALKPVNFAWKVDGTRVDGFLAHEAQEVVPEAVTGTKDAMTTEEYEITPAVLDEDGNVVTEAVMGEREVPDYQGIDQAKLVPLLTAALQDAIAEIESLKARVETLEAN